MAGIENFSMELLLILRGLSTIGMAPNVLYQTVNPPNVIFDE